MLARSRALRLLLLQRVRDEAHRFAIEFQRNLRQRRASLTSILEEIGGVDPGKRRNLLHGNWDRCARSAMQASRSSPASTGSRARTRSASSRSSRRSNTPSRLRIPLGRSVGFVSLGQALLSDRPIGGRGGALMWGPSCASLSP